MTKRGLTVCLVAVALAAAVLSAQAWAVYGDPACAVQRCVRVVGGDL